MNCTECEKLINDYIYDKLDEATLDSFVKHILSCENCLDELKINYSVLMALDQMDRGDELSEDYEAEVEEKIVRYVLKKKRRHRAYMGLCLLLLIASVFAGMLVSFFFGRPNDEIIYSTEETETTSVVNLKYDGVPDFIDPVEQRIDDYNSEVINYLHGLEKNKGE